MSDEIKQSREMVTRLESLLSEMQEMSQPRSNFALTHFVVGQHDLPGRQRKQVLDELYAMLFSLADMNDDHCLAEIDLAEARERYETAEGYEKDRLEVTINKSARAIRALEIAIEGRLKECKTLLGILDAMPKYTSAQLEQEEADYWQRRLSRQFILGARGDFGNLDAILQLFTEPGKPKPAVPSGTISVPLQLMGFKVAQTGLAGGEELPRGLPHSSD